MEIDPGDYQTKATHLKFLKPRWGGSIEAMGEFVEESLVYLPENPRLNWLTGLVYDEVADISKDRKARNEAEKYYTQALSFGENYLVYLHRGKNRYQLDKNIEALADLDKAISLYPERSGSYYWRSVVYSELEEYEKSANDLIRAYQLDPYDASVLKQREWLTKKMIFNGYEFGKDQEYDKALAQFNYAERLNPDNPDIYQRRARVLADLNQINLASNDLKKSISLDPENYGAYALLDWVLAREGKYEEIVRYWDQYIHFKPGHSSAYVERGGAYFQMGNYNDAVMNAKIAAEMGNPLGIETYEKFKHLATN